MNALLAQVDAIVPGSQDELHLTQAIAIIVFALVAIFMGFIHTRQFDLYRVLRNGIGGEPGSRPQSFYFFIRCPGGRGCFLARRASVCH